MPKEQISIKLDSDTLVSADKAAETLGLSRSALIERAIERYLANFDSMVEEMSHDNIVTAAVMDRIAGDAKLLSVISKAMGKHLDDATIKFNVDLQPRLRAEADRRKLERKKGGG